MCGIAGIVTTRGRSPDEACLRRMANALAHRGPDGEGMWINENVGFAHRRLSIIDLSHRADQPMLSADGKYAIVFNGEIYNYRELHSHLSADWKTESDTEVILEGYRTWGDEVVSHLRGMFSFALWDMPRGRLLLARDRIGKKPLFYTSNREGDFLFASELKALRTTVPFRPDWNAVRLFLGLQYVPSPLTGFESVQQLEPGCLGIVEAGSFYTKRYHIWSTEIVSRTQQEMDVAIRSHLEEAVKIRQLAADVPVGAFLSGGVDSAAVVAYASRQNPKLQTFTMGFPNASMDERVEAKRIARHFGTEHYAFEAKPEHLLDLVDALVDHYDAPYADSSALPVWLLARETAKKIKVVLTGDGGDETFGGYRRYAAYDRALRSASARVIPTLFPMVAYGASRLLRDPRYARMADTISALHTNPTRAYGEMFCGSYFSTHMLGKVFSSDFLERTKSADAVSFIASQLQGTDLTSAMFFDLTSYLPDDLNVKMDRATMAFGLEARAPFLDQELVQFALSLPITEKVRGGQTKVALRRALRGVIPDSVLNGPKKGFQVPLAEWFRGPLSTLLRERCLGARSPLRSAVREAAVQKLIDQNTRGADYGNRLWMLLTLSTWLSRYGI